MWLLAAPFSGVSWLAASLDGHPSLYALPELDLLLADGIDDTLNIYALGQSTHGQGLYRALARIEFGHDDNAGVAAAQQWLDERRDWRCADVIRHLAARVAPRRLVIPERDAVMRPFALTRIPKAFPDSHLLHLTRHPWEQGVLMAAWARERVFVPLDYKDHAQDPPQPEPQLPWYRANRNITAFLARLPTDRSLHVQTEQVEQAPDDAFIAICDWLGLRHDAETLSTMRQAASWSFARRGPDDAPYGLEDEAYEPFSAATLALAARTKLTAPVPWRTDGKGFDPLVKDYAAQLGYGEG